MIVHSDDSMLSNAMVNGFWINDTSLETMFGLKDEL